MRRFPAAVATVLASVAMLATLLAYAANHVLVSSSGFASRAIGVVQTGAVESAIVNQVTGRVTALVGDQPSVQPLVQTGVREALANPQVTKEIRTAARSLQTQLLSGHADSLTLTLPGVSPAIAATVRSRSPALAAEISRIGTLTVVDVPIPSGTSSVLHDLTEVGRDCVLLIVLSAALIALALLLSVDRKRTLVGLGVGAVLSGLLAAAIYLAGRGLVVDQFSAPDVQAAAGAAWKLVPGWPRDFGVRTGRRGRGGRVAGRAGVISPPVYVLLRDS